MTWRSTSAEMRSMSPFLSAGSCWICSSTSVDRRLMSASGASVAGVAAWAQVGKAAQTEKAASTVARVRRCMVGLFNTSVVKIFDTARVVVLGRSACAPGQALAQVKVAHQAVAVQRYGIQRIAGTQQAGALVRQAQGRECVARGNRVHVIQHVALPDGR